MSGVQFGLCDEWFTTRYSMVVEEADEYFIPRSWLVDVEKLTETKEKFSLVVCCFFPGFFPISRMFLSQSIPRKS